MTATQDLPTFGRNDRLEAARQGIGDGLGHAAVDGHNDLYGSF